MNATFKFGLTAAFLLGCLSGLVQAQEAMPTKVEAEDQVAKTLEEANAKISELSRQLDQSKEARDVSAGILDPIYKLAERLGFPAFHWIAFAIMAAGVVSFALQLVVGKLVVLMKGSISLTEIISDALALVISLVGLVLTTQAATENSDFTRSPFSVLSASALGVLAGFLLYIWAQRQEVQAARGRRVTDEVRPS
ncbi:MAG: hypothetical protein AB7O26_09735 [Planctomycetaceae bacterium]